MTRFRVLLRPTLIVPDHPQGKLTIADEGSIVKLMDMKVMFRDRLSPVTRRADEILVAWGKKGKEQLGWLAVTAAHSMKPIAGPMFLVRTKDKKKLLVWDQLRYEIANADLKQKNKQRWWLVPWCTAFGKDHLPEIKKTIREFGGKAKDTQDPDVHCEHLARLILKTEVDMATARADSKTAKKGKIREIKKGKVTKIEESKKSKKKGEKQNVASAEKLKKAAKEANPKKFDPRSRDFDTFVVKRLVKENPRKAGTSKAKIWDKLKKGMSVGEFVERGGTRGAIAKYISKGWVKLLRPKDDE